jgi:multiple sugar transport system substrate-binding protein
MFKKAFLIVTILSMVLIVACTKSTTTPSTTPSDNSGASTTPGATPAAGELVNNGPVVLQYLQWYGKDAIPKAKPATDLFTKKYPWITIDYVIDLGQGEIPQLQQAIAVGKPIDVFWNSHMWDPFKGGYVEDLTPYIKNDTQFQAYKFNPGLLEAYQYGGEQYGLPRSMDMQGMFINKTLMTQLGLTMPADDWTYDDLTTMVNAGTNVKDHIYGFDHGSNFRTIPDLRMVADGYADQLGCINKDATGTMCDAGNQGAMDTLNWWYDLTITKGNQLNDAAMNAAGLGGQDLWKQGQALFTSSGTWMISFYNNKDDYKFDWAMIPFPKGKVSAPQYGQNNGMFLSKASKYKKEAWAFMSFLTTNTQAQETLMDGGWTFPTSSDPELVSHFASVDVYKNINKDTMAYIVKNAIYNPSAGMVGGMDADWTLGINWDNMWWAKGKKAEELVPGANDETNTKLKADQAISAAVIAQNKAQ